MPASEPLIAAEGLRAVLHTRRGELAAVDDVSLAVRRGEVVGVVGESGSGKTMLLRSLMGLHPPGTRVTTTGSVRFEGEELVGRPERELRRRWGPGMAVVPQHPQSALNPVMRIGRQVEETLRRHRGLRGDALHDAALRSLQDVGIADPARRLRQYPHELSGGMRQRVAIAMALAGDPRLLLADEPTTALDVTVQAQILELLKALQRERAMGMLLVTHNLAIVLAQADRVVVMYAGQVVESAPAAVLARRRRMPYTQALFDALPERARRGRLRALAGRPPDLLAPPPGCRFAARCPRAQARCREALPPLVADADGHASRCWYPLEPAGRVAA